VKQEQTEAKIGKTAAVKAAKTADERMKELALADDYRLEEKLANKKGKMTRKKRRRQEALDASKEMDEGEEGDAEIDKAKRLAKEQELAPRKAKVM
jgi:uncharacterized cupredoxin-like copper-binding protein